MLLLFLIFLLISINYLHIVPIIFILFIWIRCLLLIIYLSMIFTANYRYSQLYDVVLFYIFFFYFLFLVYSNGVSHYLSNIVSRFLSVDVSFSHLLIVVSNCCHLNLQMCASLFAIIQNIFSDTLIWLNHF